MPRPSPITNRREQPNYTTEPARNSHSKKLKALKFELFYRSLDVLKVIAAPKRAGRFFKHGVMPMNPTVSPGVPESRHPDGA
jgi:hypothetical protein